jgi:hypothetical protein
MRGAPPPIRLASHILLDPRTRIHLRIFWRHRRRCAIHQPPIIPFMYSTVLPRNFASLPDESASDPEPGPIRLRPPLSPLRFSSFCSLVFFHHRYLVSSPHRSSTFILLYRPWADGALRISTRLSHVRRLLPCAGPWSPLLCVTVPSGLLPCSFPWRNQAEGCAAGTPGAIAAISWLATCCATDGHTPRLRERHFFFFSSPSRRGSAPHKPWGQENQPLSPTEAIQWLYPTRRNISKNGTFKNAPDPFLAL